MFIDGIHLKFVQQFSFTWEERYILFSGLLVGISFVILVPFLVPEFDRIYKLTGTVGWLGAFLCLHQNRTLLDIVKGRPPEEKEGKGSGPSESAVGTDGSTL